jgi:integrase
MPVRVNPTVDLNERDPARANQGSIFKPMKEGDRLYDSTVSGLYLQAGRRGRTYHVVTQSGATQVRRSLGKAQSKSGVAGALSVEEARTLATQVIEAVVAGVDLEVAKRRREKAAASAEVWTFKAVADAYLEDTLRGGGARLKSVGELKRKLKVDLAVWHDLPIADIDDDEILRLIAAKALKHGPAANRLLSFIKRVFAYAKKKKRIAVNPTHDIDRPVDEAPRSRRLSEAEIRLFWQACDKLGDPAGRLFKFALVTGQRRGEVAGLRRSEIGVLEEGARHPKTGRPVEAWLLPAERTKRNSAHNVPLSKLARSLIDGAPALAHPDGKAFDHVFASGRRGDGPVSGWSRFKEQLDREIGRLIAEEADEKYDPAVHKLKRPWHVHDLRRTCATRLQMPPINAKKEVISRVLNHSEGFDGSMTAIYARHGFDDEAALALEAWGGELQRIVRPKVHPLKRRAA